MVKNKRMAGLDLFRLLAALVVFLFHSQAHMGCSYGIADGFVSMGAIFMTGFFLLSGYTLMAVYQNKPLAEKAQRNQFYCKRFFGIFPVYYAVGLVHTLFLAWEEPFYRVLLMPIELLGLQSVFSSLFPFAHNSGTWFISCLVLCYLLYPFLQECVKEMAVKWKWLLLVICGFVILYAPLIVHHFGIASIYTNPFFRILEFLIGILLASVKDRLRSCKKLRLLFGWPAFLVELVVLFTGVSVGIRLDIGTGNYMLYNWISLPVFILMLTTLSALDCPRLERSPLVQYFSKISYEFFLAQFFTFRITGWILETLNLQHNLWKILLSFAICLLLSVVMHEVLGKPAAKYLYKHFSSYPTKIESAK